MDHVSPPLGTGSWTAMWLTEELPGRHTQKGDEQGPSIVLVFLRTCAVAEVNQSQGVGMLNCRHPPPPPIPRQGLSV